MSEREPRNGEGEWTTQGLGRTRLPEQPRVAERYEVLAHLGRGGAGSVYRVFDRARDVTVAQKRLMLVDDPARRARLTAQFEREYHTLSELAHPSIIKVYDYGLDECGPYYTMELVDGGDLRSQGPMPWRRVCEVLYDIASSLAILHSRRRVHRDVTTRNVRFTSDGAARLIDFGLMAPMGVVKDVAGTPPFMAPETVQQQSLDGRADLFSLGALAYAALTGCSAFPAKRIDQLRDMWRTPPRPPSRTVEGIPAALENLVMRLISLDRGLRPTNASEVMEKVAAMLGRKQVEVREVSAAYLTTPTLVGRDAQLLQVRRLVINAMRNQGQRIVVTGGRGAGRSRFLDACVLEGKLAGATVVRVDAADGARGDYGGARAVIAQLLMSAPEASARLGTGHNAIAWLMPQASAPVAVASAKNFLETDATRTAQMVETRDVIRTWVRALSRDRTVMIAVDDLHRLDEPSAAVLAALASDADSHRLLLVATVADEQGQSGAAARWFQDAARQIILPPLTDDDVSRLLAGVFGDVHNLSPLSKAMHPLCKGSPKACMMVAKHLVDHGTARYHAGAWTLPASLQDSDLPSSVSDATRAQLATLSPAARELLDFFAFGDGSLSLDAVPMLGAEADRAELFHGLDELMSGCLLEAADEHYRLADPEVVFTVRKAASAERAVSIHSRLADLLHVTGDSGRREAEHRVAAGDPCGAIEPMLRFLSVTPPWSSGTTVSNARLLDQIITAALADGRTDAELIPLELNLLRTAVSLQVPDYLRHAHNVFARLTRAVGFDMIEQFAETDDPKERPTAILQAATARFTAEGGASKTLHPFEALLSLAAVGRAVTMVGAGTNNLDLLNSQPSLAVFAPLIPALKATIEAAEAGRLLARGKYSDSLVPLEALIELLEQPNKLAVSPLIFEMIRNNVKFAKGMLYARFGLEEAFSIADELEESPSFQVNAWILRMSAHLRLGDVVAAQAGRRRVELLNMEQRPPQSLEAPAMLGELDYYSWVRDVVGMRETLARVEAVTAIHASWKPWERATRASYEALRGNLTVAEQELAELIAEVPCSTHAARAWAEGQHLHVLYQLGRFSEVCEVGHGYMTEGDVVSGDPSVRANAELSIALACGQLGRTEEAKEMVSRTLDHLDEAGVRGMIRAVAYQRRALLACMLGDGGDFTEWASRFLSAVEGMSVQAAGGLHAQLISEARTAGFDLDARYLLASRADEGRFQHAERMVREVLSLGEGSRSQGVHQLLALLVERSRAVAGLLFEVVRGRPLLTASLECSEDCAVLAQEAVVNLLEDLQSHDEECTVSTMDSGMDGVCRSLPVGERQFRVVLLSAEAGSGDPTALVLLREGPGTRNPHWELLTAVAAGLAQIGG